MEVEIEGWGLRHFEGCAFEVFFEPQKFCDSVFIGVVVVEVGGDAESCALVREVAPVPSHVVDVRVEIVGGREPENGAGDVWQVGVVGDAGEFHLGALRAATAGDFIFGFGEISGSSA